MSCNSNLKFVNNVEKIRENNKLKKQLTGISQELKNLREQLGQDSEIQLQLKELIVKQNEIIAQQKIKDAKQQYATEPRTTEDVLLVSLEVVAHLMYDLGMASHCLCAPK